MPNHLIHFLPVLRNWRAIIALLTLTAPLLILAPKSAIAQTTPTFGAATMPDTTYTVNTAVSDTLPVATGGTGTLTYTLTPDLPAGLTYNAAASGNGGVIAGTPTTAASATTYTLTATDANNATTALTFTLSVALSSDATLSRLTFYSVEQAASGVGGQTGGVGGQNDANLRNIQIEDFTFHHLTIRDTFRFTVEAKVTFLTVKPTTNDSTATYTIKPEDSRSRAGHQVDLVKPATYDTISTTPITVKVTAANGDTTTYTIAVTRKGSKNYDADGDSLIAVRNLAQLNAIRYDLDGNGQVDRPNDANAYARAFPDIGPIPGLSSMGCPSSCTGYELLNDLDFDTNGDGLITVADNTYFFIGTKDSTGFVPIAGAVKDSFKATFKGNGHTISNLFINSSTTGVGLFRSINGSGRIEGVGLIGAKVTGSDSVGALVGFNKGTVIASYSTASVVTGNNDVGALVGINKGTVVNSYVTGIDSTDSTVSGSGRSVGGLVGKNDNDGRVIASYSTASVTGSSSVGALVGDKSGTIQASYAIGKVSGSSQGLVGSNGRGASITYSYYDSVTTGVSGQPGAKTTAQLQAPTSYTSTLGNGANAIYSAWNVNVDSPSTTRNNSPDNPWSFGESNQYPVLRYAGHDTTAQFAAQPDKAPNFDTATVRDTTYTAKVAVLDTLPAALATSGNGKLTYALTPDLPTGLGLTFNNMTRVISGKPTTAASASTYTLTATDADANTAASDTDTLTFTISVYSAPTFAATMRDTTYTVNIAVSDTLPGATGGTGTLTYALTPAPLPAGLTYKAATSGNGGVIAGTPTTAAPARTYTLTATATDANIAASDTDTLTFTLAVRNALARPGKPTNVQVKPWVAAIIVSWDTVNATGYTVQWKSGSETYDSETRERMTTTTTDTIPKLKAGTTYTVQVIATRTDVADTSEVTGMPASLDIDGNGRVELLSDITLIIRYVLGIQGESLTDRAVSLDATRRTPQEIEPYLAILVDQKILDVDGNGKVEMLSDIILIIRYVLDLQGESLTDRAVSSDATCTTHQDIEPYICSLDPNPNCSPSSKAAISMDAAETAHILSALAADGDLTSLLFALGVLVPTADFDGDGQVTFADFLTFADKFSTRRGDAEYAVRYDLDSDGEIGFADFLIFADSFGSAD